ncbi:MAG: molybdopterin molybdotransferase MoeA [Alphaproteobacteria bacterium]
MAQLSDDCFDPGTALLSLDQALTILHQRLKPVVPDEPCALSRAAGRILANDVMATRSVPPTDNSAVDGYAVRHADLRTDTASTLTVVGRATAGHPWPGHLQAGQAVRIFTGAVMPAGADTILMQEDCVQTNDTVTVSPGIRVGANRRQAGEDVMAGQVLITAGRRLRPADIGLLAAQGLAEVAVRRRLRVAVLSTGDEVHEPGAVAPHDAIYDANRYMLVALLDGLAMDTLDLGILPDTTAAISEALARAAHGPDAADVVITSGGMSVGEEDHMRAAVAAVGRLDFWRLAIKPGRPVAMGAVDRHKANPAAAAGGEPLVFIGLPGNPVAVGVTFMRLARPALLRLAGATDTIPNPQGVSAGFAMAKKAGRREWVRVRLVKGPGDQMAAERFASDGAGILSSLAAADGLVELPEDTTQVTPGDLVTFYSYGELT